MFRASSVWRFSGDPGLADCLSLSAHLGPAHLCERVRGDAPDRLAIRRVGLVRFDIRQVADDGA